MKAEKNINWITTLRSTSIQELIKSGNLQLNLFSKKIIRF